MGGGDGKTKSKKFSLPVATKLQAGHVIKAATDQLQLTCQLFCGVHKRGHSKKSCLQGIWPETLRGLALQNSTLFTKKEDRQKFVVFIKIIK